MAKKLVIVVGAEKVVDQIGMGAFPLFLEVVEFGRPAVIRVLEGTHPPPS
jgi:ribose 5-phosphate isomerase